MAIDVTIYEEGTGGDLLLINEDLSISEGLFNQVYLALFGGNIEQDTDPELEELETRSDFWGNNLLDGENQFNSTFERTISEVALNSEGLSILENAIKADLEYLEEYAEISVTSEIVSVNRVEFYINLVEPNEQSTKVKLVWDGMRKEPILEIVI